MNLQNSNYSAVCEHSSHKHLNCNINSKPSVRNFSIYKKTRLVSNIARSVIVKWLILKLFCSVYMIIFIVICVGTVIIIVYMYIRSVNMFYVYFRYGDAS